jgi:hypothetical protein
VPVARPLLWFPACQQSWDGAPARASHRSAGTPHLRAPPALVGRFAVPPPGHHEFVNAEDPNGLDPVAPVERSRAAPGLVELSEQLASARGCPANGHAATNGATPSAEPAGSAPRAGETSSSSASAPPPRPPGDRRSARWLTGVDAAAGRLGSSLSRPPVRLAATGVILLVLAAVLLPSSVWTLPLVVAGVMMVLVAWIGSRLKGHFLIEWGESGTRLDFHAELASAGHRQPAANRARAIAAVPAPPDAAVIDGEAHTVEIDIAELKALIAAAEGDEPGSAGAASNPPFRARARRH